MSDDLKSAWELALEKLEQQEGMAVEKLTEEQKAAIAEVRSKYQAKIAELEIHHQSRLKAALLQGDPEKAEQLRQELARERQRLNDLMEKEVRKIRQGRQD